jgi:hypothetical protein
MNETTQQIAGRIKPGARCMQDFQFFRWPLEGVDPSTRFVFTARQGRLTACAPGFGLLKPPGSYGNGSIYVYAAPGGTHA